MRKAMIFVLGSFVLMAAPLAMAQTKTIQLPADNAMAKLAPGPGRQVVVDNCSICHSTDYIVRQPKADRAQWHAEVEKMIKVFGAPPTQDQAKVIADYIASHYGVKAATK